METYFETTDEFLALRHNASNNLNALDHKLSVYKSRYGYNSACVAKLRKEVSAAGDLNMAFTEIATVLFAEARKITSKMRRTMRHEQYIQKIKTT